MNSTIHHPTKTPNTTTSHRNPQHFFAFVEIKEASSPSVLTSWRSVWKDRNEDTAYLTAWKRIQDKLTVHIGDHVATEQLHHFSHEHALSLVRLQLDHNKENSDTESDDKDKDDVVVEEQHVGKCKMCREEIYTFHRCYYSCDDCEYCLHMFCAQLPTIQRNHPLHPGHDLTLSLGFQFQDPDYFVRLHVDRRWKCDTCKVIRRMFYNYHCSICGFTMDIICATMSKQKMDHPSHPHQLQRDLSWMTSFCYACGEKHSGTFYHCKTCYWFRIHLDCALLPSKLLIQQSTNESFSHPHVLTLAYSFPLIEIRAKFYPPCRVCDDGFFYYRWHYSCNKCQYYVHIGCATSKNEAFMSIMKPAGLGKTVKNFKDDDYPKLIRCPFPDESINLVTMHQCIDQGNGKQKMKGKIDGELFGHNHSLILYDTEASLLNASVSLHDPMKKVELLCDGCVRPVTALPFYKCSQHQCGFILHEWCTRLPSKIQNHPGHPEHALVFLPKCTEYPLGLFSCGVCGLISNGFAYACLQCEYYVDLNCGFIPDVITHEAHPNHLLLTFKVLNNLPHRGCKACNGFIDGLLGFHCPTCDFYLDPRCALSLPRTIKHKYDKHSLSLRYGPVENHISEYFCEICEDEFNPQKWFYHCSICASSMHTACAPLKLQCEKSVDPILFPVFPFSNVKFGRTIMITDHPHPLTFIQGINDDGTCDVCHEQLQHSMIFKCFRCKFALHYRCLTEWPAIHDAS